MNASMTSVVEPATDEQWKQIKRLFEDMAPKVYSLVRKRVALDKTSAQVVVMNGGDLQDTAVDAILAKIESLTASDQYADEEMDSSYTYPPEYKPKPLAEQIAILVKHFPQLKVEQTNEWIANVLPTLSLPAGAEGYFAIPRPERIAPTYHEALQQVLAIIGKGRKFQNYREGELGPEYVRQCERTAKFLRVISEQQTGNILVIPAQFGLKYRGKSTRRSRELFNKLIEFGLGGFQVGCMLLTHPDRAVRTEELDMDCAGDEYAPGADGDFSRSLYFSFYGGRLEFGYYWVWRCRRRLRLGVRLLAAVICTLMFEQLKLVVIWFLRSDAK